MSTENEELKNENEVTDNAAETSETPEPKAEKKDKKGHKADDKLKKELEEANEKIADLNDKYLRLSAEFDNYKKRTLKERSDMLKTISGDTLSGMLPVIDDLERALASIEKAVEIEPVKEGVSLIYSKLREYMKNKGLVEIEALNQDFDTDLHEAVAQFPAQSDDMKGKVVDVIQKGYKIDTKVVRFAKVVVGI